jgi:hypothetical protein
MMKLLFAAIILLPVCLKAQDTSRRIKVDTAHQKPMSMTDTLVLGQFDGTRLHVVCNGGTFESYCETTDGYTLALNNVGVYEYAVAQKDGDLVPNGTIAKDENKRSGREKRALKKMQKHLRYSGEKLEKLREIQKKLNDDADHLRQYAPKKKK